MTSLIVAILVFVLSYFNFAVVLYEFKLLFYTVAALIFVCSGFLVYNVVAITSSPCVPINTQIVNLFSQLVDGSFAAGNNNVFAAKDAIGITVFFFDIVAAGLMFFTGRSFYQRG